MLTSSCSTYKVDLNTNYADLKVLSYNIHHANPPSKKNIIDIDAIAKVISDSKADVVALQEVDQLTKRSGNANQAQLIAQKAGLKYYQFFKAINYDGGDYGVAILSRFPLAQPTLISLPQQNVAEERVLAFVKIKVNGKSFVFANTHLDATGNPANRNVQMQQILKTFETEKLPVILCGDLNSVAGTEAIKLLDSQFKRSCIENCEGTIPEINPNRTIDYIAVKNWVWPITKHQVIAESYASDHRPLLATFNLKP
jgi:endonuclease/exonuclease/phosphatase family metal-dependent hydrolase